MSAPAPAAPSFGEALRYWLKLGFISFGGPAGQIAIMHQELVERRRWISEQRFLHALNYCMVLPGPEAQQLATYIGWLLHGVKGGIAAGALFVLPSLFILIGLSWIYLAWDDVPAVAGVLYGVKPAVVAIVLAAAWRIGTRTLRNGLLWLIAAAAFIAIFALRLPFPAIILGAAVIGAIGGRWLPQKFRVAGAHGPAHPTAHLPSVVDDDTPPPAHARFSWGRLARVVVIGLALWAGAFGLLLACFGAGSTFAQMGAFFSKAALLTFGGAYAVLPYVYQAAVEQYQWLTATQMIDGLALGETTPGPLIMIVSFVGFVGGWSAELAGGSPAAAGIVGATVATFFTFLPSFLFILAGGPLVEATHGELRFTAPLTAITAAVVGVIVNLALFFAWHVFWPGGSAAAPDPVAMLISAAALLALLRFRQGVVRVILVCALLGLVRALILA